MSSLPVAAIGARPASGEGSIGPADADEVHRFAKANGILVSALAKGEYKQLVRVPTLKRPVRRGGPREGGADRHRAEDPGTSARRSLSPDPQGRTA
jgi:hypothetical protein